MIDYQLIDDTSGTPDISIGMLAYNHEKYIAEALDSVLMQKTKYSFKIVLAEDKSTDETRAIILAYQKKHPDKIKLILQNKNVGAHRNNLSMFANLEGTYVAALEGDDYWIDPLKLQKQVDFLEANHEYGLCHTDFSRYIQKNKKRIYHGNQFHNKDVFYGLMKAQYPIGTLTAVFRTEIWKDYSKEIDPVSKGWLMGDLPFWLYLSRFYKAYYLNEVSAVYRVLEESASHTRQIEKMIQFDKSIKEVKLFFLNKYGQDCTNRNEIKNEIEVIFIYRKIIAFAECKGDLSVFFSLLFQFHKINRNLRYFLGSFKQILVRFF